MRHRLRVGFPLWTALIVQVDLLSGQVELPSRLGQMLEGVKDIRFKRNANYRSGESAPIIECSISR